MAALAHVLLAVLAVALALVSMRRADRAEADAVLAIEAMRRLRGELASLAGRAEAIEDGVSDLNRRRYDETGDVGEAGALLAGEAFRLTVAVRGVRDGDHGR